MLKIKTCQKIVENKNILENYWKIILLQFYTTLPFLLYKEISIAIICSSGFITIVSKIGSSGSIAIVAKRSL